MEPESEISKPKLQQPGFSLQETNCSSETGDPPIRSALPILRRFGLGTGRMLARSMFAPMKRTIRRSFSIMSDAFDVSKNPSLWPERLRSHSCNALTAKNNREEVTVSGWVDSIRIMKDSVFIVVRDGEGSVQTLFDCDGDGLPLRLC